MDELRIPKVAVSITCHTSHGQAINGQIFLDMLQTEGYTTSQILEFFNSPDPFFPLKISQTESVIVGKEHLLFVDVPGLFDEYESEVFSAVDEKREVTLYFRPQEKMTGQLIVGMPMDHSRVLDVLNTRHSFVPLLLEHTMTVINLRHVYLVEERRDGAN